MNTTITSAHKNTQVVLSLFGHKWEPWVPDPPGEWTAAKLPPPLDVWSPQTAWKLLECKEAHDGSCADITVKRCQESEARRARLLQNYNLVFGVTRNKAFASSFRAKKQAEAELEDEEEQDDLDAEDDEDESEASESDEEDDEIVEDQEQDDKEEADDEEDEDEQQDDDNANEPSSSSSSENDEEELPVRKPKRGVKRSAPSK